jgi:hypothetical protein
MNDFRMGQHEEAIRQLQQDVTSVRTEVEGVRMDTRAILIAMAEKRGERRTLVKFGALVGGGVGSVCTLLIRLAMVKLGVHA